MLYYCPPSQVGRLNTSDNKGPTPFGIIHNFYPPWGNFKIPGYIVSRVPQRGFLLENSNFAILNHSQIAY